MKLILGVVLLPVILALKGLRFALCAAALLAACIELSLRSAIGDRS